MGLIGFAAGENLSAGGLTLEPGSTPLDGFSVVMLNDVTGQELGGEGRYLLTAVSRCRNQDMKWNKARNSVGTNWGSGPSLCTGVPLRLTVPRAEETSVHLYALEPDGTRRAGISPVERTGKETTYRVGPDQETLWYELRIDR